MLKKGQVSTEVDKKPFVFSLIAFTVGTAVTVLLFVLSKGAALAIFAGIMMAIMSVAAGAVLFALVTDRAYIDDGVLYMSYLFKRKSIPIEKIGKITLREDVYYVYGKDGAAAGTINSKLTSVGDVITELDKSGVNFI